MIWILLVVIASVIFTYFASYILPKWLFRMDLLKKLNKGVGQKVVEETYGTTVLYEADKSINKYVSQYLISNRDNKTILLCEIDTSIYYLDYTCVCYDKKGNVCKMITVKENDINIRTKFSSLVVYGLVEMLLLFGLGYFIKFCLSKNSSGVFHASFMRDGITLGFIGLVLGLVLASILIIYATHKVNYKEVK